VIAQKEIAMTGKGIVVVGPFFEKRPSAGAGVGRKGATSGFRGGGGTIISLAKMIVFRQTRSGSGRQGGDTAHSGGGLATKKNSYAKQPSGGRGTDPVEVQHHRGSSMRSPSLTHRAKRRWKFARIRTEEEESR